MSQSIILGIGTGRCGLRSLTTLLNQQPEVQSSYKELPWLPWRAADGERIIKARLARFRNMGRGKILGDVAPFYLPYLEIAIAAEPGIRIVCLRRPREEVVASYCQWLDQTMPLPTNHWAKQPAAGWHHDPVKTPTFPQYNVQSREEGIRRYWDEYHRTVEELAKRYPNNLRLFETHDALNTRSGLAEMLGFLGIGQHRQVLALGTHV